MADIREIPLDSAEEMQDIVEEIPEQPEPEPEPEPIKPKAKGRPKGALNKGPPKPRAKKDSNTESPRGRIPAGIRALLSQEKSQTAEGSEL